MCVTWGSVVVCDVLDGFAAGREQRERLTDGQGVVDGANFPQSLGRGPKRRSQVTYAMSLPSRCTTVRPDLIWVMVTFFMAGSFRVVVTGRCRAISGEGDPASE